MDNLEEQSKADAAKINLVDNFVYAGLPYGVLCAVGGAIIEVCSKASAPELLGPTTVFGTVGVLFGVFASDADDIRKTKAETQEAWREVEETRLRQEARSKKRGLDLDGN